MGKSVKYNSDTESKFIGRNFVAKDGLRNKVSKVIPHKNARREKDARRSWKNEDY